MAKFEFPVKLHRFTNEEFTRKKAEYNAKYGYTMNIPGLSDIVKFDTTPAPTEIELAQYKAKDVDALGQYRYDKIQKLMQAKKESFLRMMDSPNPTWLNNIGTSMTFLDDVNDACGTLSAIARIGAHVLPKAVGRMLLGPAGWALLAADIANIAMSIMRAPISRVMRKSSLSKATSSNPFCKEARVARANRLKRIKPSKGEVIEALQVTNNVFGVGLSLGPIVGAIEEAFAGPARVLMGERVRVKYPITHPYTWELRAMEGLEACQQLNTGGQELSDEDHIKSYIVSNMASQCLYPFFQEYHPFDNIEGVENIIRTPRPVRDPGTKHILEEAGIDWHTRDGFLHSEGGQSSVGELMDIGFDLNTKSFLEVAENTKHDYKGLVGAQSVNDFAQNSLALIEGEDQVELDYHPVEKAMFTIMDAGWIFWTATTDDQVKCFADKVMELDALGINLPFKELKPLIHSECGIYFLERP
jgi:hypothetical protein